MLSLHRHGFRAMGSPCELHLYAPTAAQADAAATAIRAGIERLEQLYSRYRDDSVTTRINRSAGSSAGVEVDAETAGLLDYAQQVYQLSDGLFDITSGVLRQVWDFKSGRLPAQARIDETLPRIGWQRLRWERPRLVLPVAGMELDFGGYVKEYAADAAADCARRNGIAHGLVELGGDIAVIGAHPDGSPWRVGIRNPRVPEQAIAMVDLHAGGIASSGDYERYMEVDGQRYGHILNPLTGWPVRGLSAVSVIAPQCLIAGSASTVAMLKGAAGPEFLRELGLPYLCIDEAGKLSGTLADSNLDAASEFPLSPQDG
jgi:thiamine biosynthesis lipoprotein